MLEVFQETSMSFFEILTLLISGALVLVLVLGCFSLLNAWMIRRERVNRR